MMKRRVFIKALGIGVSMGPLALMPSSPKDPVVLQEAVNKLIDLRIGEIEVANVNRFSAGQYWQVHNEYGHTGEVVRIEEVNHVDKSITVERGDHG